jgi:flagellar biosynthetic protein FliO
MEILQQVAAVGGVLSLLVGTLWWLRRRGYAVSTLSRRGAVRHLKCVERVALGPQQSLHLLRLGDRALLVASSPTGCTLLESFPWRLAGLSGEDPQ